MVIEKIAFTPVEKIKILDEYITSRETELEPAREYVKTLETEIQEARSEINELMKLNDIKDCQVNSSKWVRYGRTEVTFTDKDTVLKSLSESQLASVSKVDDTKLKTLARALCLPGIELKERQLIKRMDVKA